MKTETCHRGHTTALALWDCPVCVENLRGELAQVRAERDRAVDLLQSFTDDNYQSQDLPSWNKKRRDFLAAAAVERSSLDEENKR